MVTGVRGQARSATDSTVPVDVLSAAEFANQGDTDLSNLLRNVVPSYNVNAQPISDAAYHRASGELARPSRRITRWC